MIQHSRIKVGALPKVPAEGIAFRVVKTIHQRQAPFKVTLVFVHVTPQKLGSTCGMGTLHPGNDQRDLLGRQSLQKVRVCPVRRWIFVLNKVVLRLIKGGRFGQLLKCLEVGTHREQVVQEHLVVSRLLSQVPELEVLPVSLRRTKFRRCQREKARRVTDEIVGLRQPVSIGDFIVPGEGLDGGSNVLNAIQDFLLQITGIVGIHKDDPVVTCDDSTSPDKRANMISALKYGYYSTGEGGNEIATDLAITESRWRNEVGAATLLCSNVMVCVALYLLSHSADGAAARTLYLLVANALAGLVGFLPFRHENAIRIDRPSLAVIGWSACYCTEYGLFLVYPGVISISQLIVCNSLAPFISVYLSQDAKRSGLGMRYRVLSLTPVIFLLGIAFVERQGSDRTFRHGTLLLACVLAVCGMFAGMRPLRSTASIARMESAQVDYSERCPLGCGSVPVFSWPVGGDAESGQHWPCGCRWCAHPAGPEILCLRIAEGRPFHFCFGIVFHCAAVPGH